MRKEHDLHHRKPRSIGGMNEFKNVAKVPRNKHEAYHLLFSNLTAPQIADVLNMFWIDPDYFMVAVPRIGDPHV